MVRFSVITPPVEAVTLEDMKAHLRVDHEGDDEMIEALIYSAQAGFESGDMGILCRPVVWQDVEIELSRCDALPASLFGPIDENEDFEIVYRDSAGADLSVDAAAYRVDRANTFAPRLVALSGWPNGNDVRIRCTVGMQVNSDDPRLGNFKSAIKLHVQKIYDGVEDTSAIDTAIAALLQPYRVLSI